MSAQLEVRHRDMLEQESGICSNVIDARGYRTVNSKADLEHLGFSPKQRNVPALLLPLYSPTGEQTINQVRPDNPRLNDKSKPVKYETPAGAQMVLDMHPFAKDRAGDPKTRLWLTEGIKKGDALVSHDECAVALIGVWNFRGTNDEGGKVALPEWEYIALNGRDVYIVFDSDVMAKREVAKALERLKAMLEHRGAKVKLVNLPDAEDGQKQGVDDYLAAGHSTEELLELATTPKDKARSDEISVNRQVREVVAEIAAHLKAMEYEEQPRIYSRGDGLLVEMRDGYELREVTKPESLKALLHDHLEPVVKKEDKRGPYTVPSVFSSNHTALLTRKTDDFPTIKAVSDIPLMLRDGSLLHTPGY